MPGPIFLAGETKVRPGVYVRVTNAGDLNAPSDGIVAALIRGSWGPLGVPTTLEAIDRVPTIFGTGGTTAVASEAFRGGARQVLTYRVGTGGTKATKNLKDTAGSPVDVVKIDAKYPGTRGNSLNLTVRDALGDATQRELLVYEGTTLRQRVLFTKGSGEPAALVDALSAAGSDWISATKLADGTNLLAAASAVALTTGADPTVNGGDYTTALSAIESTDWNVLAADTEDTSLHATIKAYIDRVRDEGKRVMAVIGEPTGVSLSTRQTNAKTFNDPALVYVANGFTRSDGTIVEGMNAAARVAGMVAGAAITESLTHAVLSDATGLVGAQTNAEIEQSIRSAALVFTLSSRRQIQVEYGITTFNVPNLDYDAGWMKIRRVRTRDNLMDRVVMAWEPLIGKVNNNPDGRATLMAVAQGVINDLIRQGALLAGTVSEDLAHPPAGDSAWFIIQVDDVDSAEHIYVTFRYSFAAVLA